MSSLLKKGYTRYTPAQVSREASKWEGEGGSIVGHVGVLRPFVYGGAGSQVHWPALAWHREESRQIKWRPRMLAASDQ